MEWLVVCGALVGGLIVAWGVSRALRMLGEAKRVEPMPVQPNAQRSLPVVPGYVLHDRIGKGGASTVYRASPENDPASVVALKVIRHEYSNDAEYRHRFRKEVEAGQRLSHPAIVRTIDWGENGSLLYIAMEMVQGECLRRYMRVRMSYEEIGRLLQPVFEGVAHAHQAGIIHRDLKPDNLMVTVEGGIKIMDFGLARHDSSTITVGSIIMGTPAYMSPEQLEGHPCNARSDQYSLGVIVYELVCAQRPFEGRGIESIVQQQIHDEPPSMKDFRDDVPPALDAAVRRMLAKSPEQRFPDVMAAWSAISSAMASCGPAPDEAA
ncbi:MAG: serine/threonine-protein kinase [Candidatus Xenobia bacterium]